MDNHVMDNRSISLEVGDTIFKVSISAGCINPRSFKDLDR